MIDGDFEAVVKERNDLLLRLAECEAAVRSHGYKRDIALERAEKAEAATEDWRLRLTEALRESEAECARLREALGEAVTLLEWTEDDDWWCEPGFTERRDAFLQGRKG
ncbi:hypothetical protein [Acidithiobacillus sp.]|uniref:hypothetical protein n=1 Tax=Acidithiobacillus sp. TaxID=1872118 RepID=UPI002584269E|nr:hypothetical protein [Acidithiobacillus sp.]MDD5375764.1 hypothetical protein [Acidithiobacillus sp.]